MQGFFDLSSLRAALVVLDDHARLPFEVVGLEIQVARLTGKWKLGQNRTEQDRAGVVDGLRREGTESAEAMAALVRGTLEGA